jgi:hypothetical protein
MNPIRAFICAVVVCAAPVYADKNWEQPTDVIILPPETRPAQVYTQDAAPPVPHVAQRSGRIHTRAIGRNRYRSPR